MFVLDSWAMNGGNGANTSDCWNWKWFKRSQKMQCNRQAEQEFEALRNLVLGNAVSSSAHKGKKKKERRRKTNCLHVFSLRWLKCRNPWLQRPDNSIIYASPAYSLPTPADDGSLWGEWHHYWGDGRQSCEVPEAGKEISCLCCVCGAFSALGPISLKLAVAGRTKM